MVDFEIQIEHHQLDLEIFGAAERAAQFWERVIVGPPATDGGKGPANMPLSIVLKLNPECGKGMLAWMAVEPLPVARGVRSTPVAGTLHLCEASRSPQFRVELEGIMRHEIGHALGIGAYWVNMGLVDKEMDGSRFYTGVHGMRTFSALLGDTRQFRVPLQSCHDGNGGRHWNEFLFEEELMSSEIGGLGDPLSRLTLAALQDLGYEVRLEFAEKFVVRRRPVDVKPGC